MIKTTENIIVKNLSKVLRRLPKIIGNNTTQKTIR